MNITSDSFALRQLHSLSDWCRHCSGRFLITKPL